MANGQSIIICNNGNVNAQENSLSGKYELDCIKLCILIMYNLLQFKASTLIPLTLMFGVSTLGASKTMLPNLTFPMLCKMMRMPMDPSRDAWRPARGCISCEFCYRNLFMKYERSTKPLTFLFFGRSMVIFKPM